MLAPVLTPEQKHKLESTKDTMRTTTIRVSYAFSRLNALRLVEFVRNVVALMTANPDYPTPAPDLATITKQTSALDDLVQKAANRDRVQIADRNQARATLLQSTRDLAAYVQGNCLNNLAVLIGSGFNAIPPKSPTTVPAAPTSPRLTQGPLSGSLIFDFKKKDRTIRNCSIQTAASPNGPWTDYGLTTKSRITLLNLPTMAVTWARARANGAAGSSAWTEPVCKPVI